MRVVSGKYKGKRFSPPKKFPSRPTTDFAKESLFNILANQLDFDEVNALDLFAGTGSLSLELVSRDAATVTSVDNHIVSYKHMVQLKNELQENNWTIIKADVFDYLKTANKKFDLIIADPPYNLNRVKELPELIFNQAILSENGIFVLEHGQENSFETAANFKESRNYGGVIFSFFELS